MKQIPVIIDCDPGADDFLAIQLALLSPELRVLGITTVFGNSTVKNTAWNATRACAFAGCESLRVYQGAQKPLCREFALDAAYGGKDGLCESSLNGNRRLLSRQPAWNYLIEALRKAPAPVTIVSTAAMTNIALAIREAPEIISQIREVVTIAGYYGFRAEAARAEWNIQVDPEAAGIVYGSGVAIRAAGLDVSSGLCQAHADKLLDSAAGKTYSFLAHATAYNIAHGCKAASILVDSMAIALVLAPEIATYQRGTATLRPQHADERMVHFEADKEMVSGNVLATDSFDYGRLLQLIKDRVME